jgi:putative inorganic carbon (HCO3(-)) transporter
MVPAPAASPLLLRWQGLLASWPAGRLGRHLPMLAGWILCALMAGLPLVTRGGLGLLISACGLLWLIWALRTPAAGVGRINAWLLAVLAVAVLATGFSPVPLAAFKGLIKLVSYLGVYALMRQLLAEAPVWWDRIVAALLAGELVTSVIGLRQLYGDSSALARWSDNNSVAEGTVRIYSTLDNPNLLGGFLLPVLPIAVVALLRWRQPLRRLYALLALLLGVAAMVFTYSRGAWMGMVASLAVLALLLLWRAIQHWPPFWRRTLPLLLLIGGAVVLLVLVTQVEPLRVRVMSLFVGREDSSNNFRINVWQAVLKMIEARPVLGIGPGNTAFNLIYPIYQTPKFNALSAYSIPLELLVEAGVPGLLLGMGLAFEACRTGVSQWRSQGQLVLPSLAAVAVFVGLAVQGLTDTIFFRPEVQLSAFFCLATLAASQHGAGRSEPRAAASEAPSL